MTEPAAPRRYRQGVPTEVPSEPTPDATPRMRGVLHLWAFFVSLVAGAILVVTAMSWPYAVFALSVAGLFGTSALYHNVRWSKAWYARVRRADHAMIFALILGTYTPLFMISLAGRGVDLLFFSTCAVAGLGVLITLLWPQAPKWVRAVVYLVVGWMGAAVAPELLGALGPSGLGLLLLGGVLYSVGAVIYAIKRPDPWPDTFGYHEIFHALVIAAVAAHFGVVAFYVV